MKLRHLHFGSYRIDPGARRLWRGSEPLALPPKPVALLQYLAENAGRLVTKRELLDHVWPGVNVCDAVVKNAIAAARAALDGDSGRRAFIETEPRRGYRFVVPVEMARVPDAVATFVGRSDAVHHGAALVAGHRLVTFTGAPGCGKSSLAAEVARRARFDGACWVDLGAGIEGAAIPRMIASALGLGDSSVDGDVDDLAHALGDRNLLLVLNDCDRSLSGVSGFVRVLLPAFPRLHLLLTSRSPVGAPGEQLLAVSPLDVPSEGLTSKAAGASDSVRLFIERACQVRPDVTFSDADVIAVASICRRLDGLPAAIEEAASFVRTFTTSEVRDRLEELLGLSPVTARHDRVTSPLVGLLEGALEPLPPDERECLVRLCRIPQPFTLADAERLLDARRTASAITAVGVLARLAGRSLISVAISGDRHSSAYRVLEPFRTYVRRRHVGCLRHPTGRTIRCARP
ncbi:MAG: winged helix-turn-helix domain-containing protein [Vicinamibacterales bacterium]